jgi:hypothetical protein
MGRNGRIILQEMTAPEEVSPSASIARVASAPPRFAAGAREPPWRTRQLHGCAALR